MHEQESRVPNSTPARPETAEAVRIMSENIHQGFTGTVPGFVDWLRSALAYGHVGVGEPAPSEISPTRLVRTIEMVTAGYSSDEALLGNVADPQYSMFALRFWASTHRGGLYTYQVPVSSFDSGETTTWLKPSDDVVQELYRARTLIVRTAGEEVLRMKLEGVRISFTEYDRDINNPGGTVTIGPVADPWSTSV